MQVALIILGVLNLIALIGLIIIFIKRNNESGAGKERFLSSLVEYQDRQKHYQHIEFQSLKEGIDRSLGEGAQRSQKAIQEVVERLIKVDEAQKSLDKLGSNVNQLQSVLTDKKTRGIFGEIQLNQILYSVFGESTGKLYDLQKSLSNSKIVDAMIYLPDPLGHLAIDSKFPLENFQKIYDEAIDDHSKKVATKEFTQNLKKHIDDISSKYIIDGETAEQAILFLPAEAIFSYIHANDRDVVDYALKKRVWITSPTTLMATLSTIQVILRNVERSNNLNEIHMEINKLGEEFSRHNARWDDLARHIQTVQKDIEKLGITHKKINDKFHEILNFSK